MLFWVLCNLNQGINHYCAMRYVLFSLKWSQNQNADCRSIDLLSLRIRTLSKNHYGGFAKPTVETCKIAERPHVRFARNALHKTRLPFCKVIFEISLSNDNQWIKRQICRSINWFQLFKFFLLAKQRPN